MFKSVVTEAYRYPCSQLCELRCSWLLDTSVRGRALRQRQVSSHLRSHHRRSPASVRAGRAWAAKVVAVAAAPGSGHVTVVSQLL